MMHRRFFEQPGMRFGAVKMRMSNAPMAGTNRSDLANAGMTDWSNCLAKPDVA